MRIPRVSDVPDSICTLIVEVRVLKAHEEYNIYWYILQILLIRGHEGGQVQHGLSSPCCCQEYQYFGLNNFEGDRHCVHVHVALFPGPAQLFVTVWKSRESPGGATKGLRV